MTKRSATRRSVTAWRMAGLLAMPGLAMAAPPPSPERDPAAERQMKIGGSFTVAAVGDIIAPQPIVDGDPAFQALAERLRKADVGFANMETSLVDFRNFSGPVGGTLSPLATARSIRDMGVTLVSRANNHTFDGGLAGMISTDGALDRAGIAHAGTGRDLHEARAAQYLATPKGRVGLVSIFSIDDSSHYGPSFSRTEASYRNGGLGGAAGLNPLHLKAYHVVAPADFEALRAIAARAQGLREAAAPANPRRFRLFGQGYEVGSDVGDVRYEIDARDAAETMASIRNGKAYADFLIATIHAHQAASAAALEVGGAEHDPANFLVRLAHDAIDNGADMFVVHGMHALHGIEIYKGKPVFYGLASFVYQYGIQLGESYDVLENAREMAMLDDPAGQMTVLTETRFENGRLVEIRLHPADLGGRRRPLSRMGTPRLPAPEVAQQILRDLQAYSKAFGTHISIEKNVGIIRIGGSVAKIGGSHR